MGESPLADFISDLTRTVNLRLQPQGGRVLAYHPVPENPDRQTIELKCELAPPDFIFSTSVVIGEEVHPPPKLWDDEEEKSGEEETGWRLDTIPIMLRIHEVDKAALLPSTEKSDAEPAIGMFKYNPRLNSGDGVVNDKWPSCSADIVIGSETFRLIRDRVLDFRKYDFDISIDVFFPKDRVDQGWYRTTVGWDGKDQLSITSAAAIWTREDWRVQARPKRQLGPPQKPEYVASPEHIELMAAMQRVEAGLKAIMTPLWVVAAGVAIWLFTHRS